MRCFCRYFSSPNFSTLLLVTSEFMSSPTPLSDQSGQKSIWTKFLSPYACIHTSISFTAPLISYTWEYGARRARQHCIMTNWPWWHLATWQLSISLWAAAVCHLLLKPWTDHIQHQHQRLICYSSCTTLYMLQLYHLLAQFFLTSIPAPGCCSDRASCPICVGGIRHPDLHPLIVAQSSLPNLIIAQSVWVVRHPKLPLVLPDFFLPKS